MKAKKNMRIKRKRAIRRKIQGDSARPRLTIFRSNTRLSSQLIDDEKGCTILSVWTKGKNTVAAGVLAASMIKQMKTKKITAVVFDRSGYRYHGTVKVFADSVRQGGITI